MHFTAYALFSKVLFEHFHAYFCQIHYPYLRKSILHVVSTLAHIFECLCIFLSCKLYSPAISLGDAMDISLLEYFVPWSRYQPYGIGVLTGCILWELKDRQVTFPVVRMKAYRIPPKSNKIGIIIYCIGNSQWCIFNTKSNYDWLLNIRSRVLQADWSILLNNEEATLNINIPHYIVPLSLGSSDVWKFEIVMNESTIWCDELQNINTEL